ncbi:MAG: TrkH family potassium uptake protein [Acidobacteria bacterium]|nr:TrkH family potassium uptake protein [Acidobacteriota bacterium]
MRVRLGQLHPSAVLVASFGGAILAGAVLLSAPVSSTGMPVSFLDALFTATSATCVTGLTVVDTGTRFSLFGQWVILALIQAGGLGIMTFAVFVALALGRQISFQDRMVIQDSLHHSPTAELRKLVRYILVFTVTVEVAGALCLWVRWRSEFPAARALYLALFHAVSAFCNAGFSVFSDSLARYRGDVPVNLVVTALVVVGGLGFLVNMELRDQVALRIRGRRPPALSLHAKLVSTVTAWLLALGTVGFLGLEWGNLLRDVPGGEKLLVSWFHSVMPRTAGFNTVDYGRAAAGTLFFTVLLMFVGGSPGSTAGGIKTTSLGLLVGLVRARWAGRGRAFLFGRTVPHTVMDRALSVTLVSWVLASGALMLLVVTEQGAAPHDAAEPRFLSLMFETVSAFATVGLSTGLTPQLTPAGKAILIVLMFVGRLGPLTVAFAAGRARPPRRFRYAEENVMVG